MAERYLLFRRPSKALRGSQSRSPWRNRSPAMAHRSIAFPGSSALVLVDADLNRLPVRGARPVHPHAVKAPRHRSIGRYRDDAAVAAERGEPLLDHLVGRRLQAHVLVLDQRADLAGDGEADEVFAGPRS